MINDASPVVTQVFSEFSENLLLFLIPLIKKYNTEAVVFGGNISNAHAYFLPVLQRKLAVNNITVALKQALLNEDASLIGAASCFKLQEAQRKELNESVSIK